MGARQRTKQHTSSTPAARQRNMLAGDHALRGKLSVCRSESLSAFAGYWRTLDRSHVDIDRKKKGTPTDSGTPLWSLLSSVRPAKKGEELAYHSSFCSILTSAVRYYSVLRLPSPGLCSLPWMRKGRRLCRAHSRHRTGKRATDQ